DDPLRTDDGGRALRHPRRGASRRARPKQERQRSARHPQAFRPGESGRRAAARDARAATRRSLMNGASPHRFPALHNAMWPGLVGKGPDSEPPIDLDTMLDLTANASVDGVKFDGVDLFLFDPHVSI